MPAPLGFRRQGGRKRSSVARNNAPNTAGLFRPSKTGGTARQDGDAQAAWISWKGRDDIQRLFSMAGGLSLRRPLPVLFRRPDGILVS